MRPQAPTREDNALLDFPEIKAALEEFGVEFFLVGGSALGGYRDDEFLAPGSASVGIGVFEYPGKLSFKIADRLKQKGFTCYEELLPGIIQVEKKVQTMIYFFIRRRHWWSSYQHFDPDKPDDNNYLRFPLRFSELEPILVRGYTVNVLKPIEDYLKYAYGDGWRSPNPGYHTKLWNSTKPTS